MVEMVVPEVWAVVEEREEVPTFLSIRMQPISNLISELTTAVETVVCRVTVAPVENQELL